MPNLSRRRATKRFRRRGRWKGPTGDRYRSELTLRAGSDIVFLGALIRFVLERHEPIFRKSAEQRTERERFFHDYLVRYTNAATLIRAEFRDTEEDDDAVDETRAVTCDRCRGYVKMVSTLESLSGPELLITDLATAHLDVLARERGYGVPRGAESMSW